MNATSRGPLHVPGRAPSILAYVSWIALLSSAGLFAVFGGLMIGLPNGRELLIIAGVLVLTTVVVVTNRRWSPLVGTLVTGALLVAILAVIPDARYDLTHPQPNYGDFAMNVLIVAGLVIACGATMGTAIQSYGTRAPRTPRWLAAALSCIGGMVSGALLVGAVVAPGVPSTAAATPAGVVPVGMSPSDFTRSSVTVGVGDVLRLVDDGPFLHVLANGTWTDGRARAAREPGAPVLDNMRVNGTSIDVGPFTKAGTYQYFCPIHPGMDLAVTVR